MTLQLEHYMLLDKVMLGMGHVFKNCYFNVNREDIIPPQFNLIYAKLFQIYFI